MEASAYLVGFHEGTLLLVSPQRDLPLCHHCLLGWLHTIVARYGHFGIEEAVYTRIYGGPYEYGANAPLERQ